MRDYILKTLTILSATLQATVALGFLVALGIVGLTAFGVVPAPI